MKTCSHCRESKVSSEFYQDKTKKHGLSSRCKPCARRQASDWALKHPEERRRIMRSWRGRTDVQVHNRKIWIKRKYDLTVDDIEQLFVAQAGACAVCECALTKYHIDHDHASGDIRGLLCRNCNLGLGFFRDSVPNLAAAIQYLGVRNGQG